MQAKTLNLPASFNLRYQVWTCINKKLGLISGMYVTDGFKYSCTLFRRYSDSCFKQRIPLQIWQQYRICNASNCDRYRFSRYVLDMKSWSTFWAWFLSLRKKYFSLTSIIELFLSIFALEITQRSQAERCCKHCVILWTLGIFFCLTTKKIIYINIQSYVRNFCIMDVHVIEINMHKSLKCQP